MKNEEKYIQSMKNILADLQKSAEHLRRCNSDIGDKLDLWKIEMFIGCAIKEIEEYESKS